MVYAVLSPFAAALLTPWLVRRWTGGARLLAAWPALLTILLVLQLRDTLATGSSLVELAWAPSLQLSLSFNLDALGLLFAILITGIGTLVVLYASRYMAGHPHAGRLLALLFAFMGAMLGVALSDNVLTLFVFWELTGFTSFLLIGFDHAQEDARSAAMQALIVTGGGGLALLAAGVLLTNVSGTTSLAAMATNATPITAHVSSSAIAALVLLAAFTKSAQVPFHFWLPNAMSAPTPVSAYLHSATMVKAGVYLVARMTPILGATYGWTAVVSSVGVATMVVGAYRAVQETDLKRILAYSTVSALGVLTMLLGVGTHEAVTASLVYLLAHACYKGALFLVAGAVDHEAGTREVTALAGLRRAMPVTALAGGAAALSMAGVPLTLGFVGKDGAYEALLHRGDPSLWLLALTVLASMLLGLSGLLVGVAPFRGHAGTAKDAHEAPWELWLPALVLATAGVFTGFVPFVLDGVVAAAATAVAGVRVDATLAVWHGFTPALALSLVTLVGVGGGYAMRNVLRSSMWRPRIGSEQVYRSALHVLDAAGRAIAPTLHSASLRSYVMAIVVTTILVVGVVVATTPGIPGLRQHTPVRPHELLVVLVVIGGAVAATTAQSTMAAVLSLGAVGYGVAVTFLLFGAPDLAMTQFSVETLTVVIYVLVFRRFRNLGTLSPPLVRVRDGMVAAGLGLVVGGLVLVTAHTETAPRLREFFVEFGPTIGHGRNIVNVILVDFRGFDTLGEITVLATAAIGVRALVRLAAADRTAASDVAPAYSTSAMFRSATKALMPLLLLFSVFLLLRGHNEPGGGFVGGLVAAAAFALYAIAFGVEQARRALLVNPMMLLGSGLLIAAVSGLPAVFAGRPFLSAVWVSWPAMLGTPVVFDVGVFLVVTGVMSMMIFSLAEDA